MKIEIIKADKAEYYFRILARNGKVLCHSETYARKRNAVEAVQLIVNGAATATVIEHV